MLITSGSVSCKLAKKIAMILDVPYVSVHLQHFPDDEIMARADDQFNQQEVIVIQSTSPPVNHNLMELFLLLNCLSKHHSRRIILVMPYFGYARQDKSIPNESSAAELIIKLLSSFNIDHLITLDLHSEDIIKKYSGKFTHLTNCQLFAKLLSVKKDSVVVAPDRGGYNRAKQLADLLKLQLVQMDKTRNNQAVIYQQSLNSDIAGRDCLIVDDIIDSGKTICQAADILHHNRAASINAIVTHGIFAEGCIERLEASPIAKLYVSDSIDKENLICDKITTLSTAEIFARWLRLCC